SENLKEEWKNSLRVDATLIVLVCQTDCHSLLLMPKRLHRYYGSGHFHFITTLLGTSNRTGDGPFKPGFGLSGFKSDRVEIPKYPTQRTPRCVGHPSFEF